MAEARTERLFPASLTRLSWPKVAGAAGDHRGPDGGISGLLGGTEKQHSVGREHTVDAGQQSLARLLREVEHDVAQEDNVEAVVAAVEGQRRRAEVGAAEIAQLANLRFDGPGFSGVEEVADNVPGRQAAVHLDAMIAAGLCALDHFGANVCALDADMPAGKRGKVLTEEHGKAVRFLT